ncbi:SH3 domain-containing protein [Desulfopila sp. IMCC35008]|uniref:SH3 domain-containing protein n=1 Tax=Desulfopila sp. IMCC35008 TaxID=2653858 RepID=UPI0013D21C6D|nr:SH3 domain-containing protein [Desulfopila sp. IMCC35008]
MKLSTKHFFATIFTLALLISITCSSASAKMVSVKGNDINLRTGPGKDNPVKYELGTGFPLKIVSKKGQWIKVSDFEGDVGWLHKDLVNSNPHMIVKANRNSKKKINIRSGPSTKNEIVGKAYYGVVFETLNQKSGWAQVKHETGLEGWIKRSLLWGF